MEIPQVLKKCIEGEIKAFYKDFQPEIAQKLESVARAVLSLEDTTLMTIIAGLILWNLDMKNVENIYDLIISMEEGQVPVNNQAIYLEEFGSEALDL